MAENENKKNKPKKTKEEKLAEINKKLAILEETIANTEEKLKDFRLKKLDLLEKIEKLNK